MPSGASAARWRWNRAGSLPRAAVSLSPAVLGQRLRGHEHTRQRHADDNGESKPREPLAVHKSQPNQFVTDPQTMPSGRGDEWA